MKKSLHKRCLIKAVHSYALVTFKSTVHTDNGLLTENGLNVSLFPDQVLIVVFVDND